MELDKADKQLMTLQMWLKWQCTHW